MPSRTALLRRRLANKLAAQVALDVATGRDLLEALCDLEEECDRLAAAGAPETEWVTYPELYAAWERISPPATDWRDVPPPY
jgi:hypothetical protein